MFMKALSQKQDNIKFWYSYITDDCFAYIALYIATRYHTWNMRTASVKRMVPIFAFHCPTYQQLIPHHWHDLATLPTHLLNHLEKGAFAVRLPELESHAVALDECHELCINKDCNKVCKLAVVRPIKDRMEFLSNYLPFRSACLKIKKKKSISQQRKIWIC